MALVTSLEDLERMLQIARRNNVHHIKVGDIEAVLSPEPLAPVKVEMTHTEDPLAGKDVNALAYETYKNL